MSNLYGLIRKIVPNIITSLALLAGCFACQAAFQGDLQLATAWILVSLFLDYTDGAIARLLNGCSEFGKVLDSLSDVIAFGLAPSALMFMLLGDSLSGHGYPGLLNLASFLIVIFAALRLSRFTVSQKSKGFFAGLPVPAAGLLIASLAYLKATPGYERVASLYGHPLVLILLILILCCLMISRIPMFSFKFCNLDWQGNQWRYIFIIISVILLILLQVEAIPVLFILYLLMSVIRSITKKHSNPVS